MTKFQLPAPVNELFVAFGITDPAQMLILLLSSILGLLLVLIILIAFSGRPVGKSELPNQSKFSAPSLAVNQAVDPVISVAQQPVEDDVSVTQEEDNSDAAAGATEQVEDFQIFKRQKQKSHITGQSATSLAADAQMSIADHLRLIEKEMVGLRDLYRGGHITRDIYIDETRSLYHQARGLSSGS